MEGPGRERKPSTGTRDIDRLLAVHFAERTQSTPSAAQRQVKIVCGADQRQVRKGLRHVAKSLAMRSGLFCKKAQMVRVPQHLLKERSEDVRARINALSEIPEEWISHATHWQDLNRQHLGNVAGKPAPTPNEEYLLYQTLVGAWPLELSGPAERDTFVKRVQEYMVKAIREAKVNSSWLDPDAKYEEAVEQFVARICDENTGMNFLADFCPFHTKISRAGPINSLSQTLLRLTAPGVPDTYQGTELWDFSLVDPDNRRPVAYALPDRLLQDLKAEWRSNQGRSRLLHQLLENMNDGRIKLFLTWRALTCRRDHPGLFTTGDYTPIAASGTRRDNVFAFLRTHANQNALIVVPRLTLKQNEAGWRDTQLALPAGMRSWTNVLTDQRVTANGQLSNLLADFPVAFLLSDAT